jgi:hypothetical protein
MLKFRSILTIPIGIMILLSFSTTTYSQSIASASLSGHVVDERGAAISGATVRITSKETGKSVEVLTEETGRFGFQYLSVGEYRIEVQLGGFERVSQELILTVGEVLELNLRLQLAGLTESVNIAAGIPLIEATRTQITETILPREVDSLPLNGRNYLDLAALSPGVSRSNPVANQRFPETSAVPGTGISITGQRFISNGFIVDGMSANDDAADLPGTFFSQEVVREFQVITSGGIAEYGRASGGFVNIVTQSGTNRYSGRLYGFLRNRRFDARNPLAASKEPFTQTQYGASLGGPLHKDRTFFFGNFEQTRLHNATVITISPASVTTINARLDTLGYPGQRVFTGLAAVGFNATNFLLRLDHNLNNKNLLTARYNLYDVNSSNARNVGGLNAVSRGTALRDRDQMLTIADVATLSANTFNDARFQFTSSQLSAPVNDNVGPAINISGVANFGTATFSPTRRDLNTFEFVDAIASQWRSHGIKTGVNFLLNRLDIDFPGALQGVYSFSSLENFLAGRYTTFQQAFGAANQFQSNPNFGVFVQDEWKPFRGLTINAGLRYDLQLLPSPINTDTNNFAPRLGLAFAPGSRRTVLRASYGIYFDRIPLRATSNALQRDGSKYRVAILTPGQPAAPTFPNTLATFPSDLLVSITSIDADIENSYSQQGSLQVERELTPSMSLSVGYLHKRGLHIILSRNVNVPGFPASAGVPNLGRPDPRFANINRFESSGDLYYNALTVSLNRRFQKWMGFRLSYTLGKSIDDVGNAFFFSPQNNFNLRDDQGLSDNDQRHRLTISGSLETPEGGSLRQRMLRGFHLSYVFTYGSPLPFNVVTGSDLNFDTNANDRPIGVARTSGRGFAYAALDLRVSRTFRFGESRNIEIIAEGFNLLNRANLQLPNGTFGTGPLPAKGFGTPTAAADPRQIQFGLRFNF